jgi:predicted phosphohydrolase
MNVWAIADLHLSFANPRRREKYAERWRDHAANIERNWRAIVQPADLVLLPGDLSMAGNHRDLQPDLAWLERLPGTKVLAPGNHDRWWNGSDAIRPLLRRSMLAVDGDAVATHGAVICGAVGSPVMAHPEASGTTPLATAQIHKLQSALAHAAALRTTAEIPLYVLWHYPPFDAHSRPGPCVELLERAAVTACVYGHLHGESEWSVAVQGTVRGVRYHCVAADAIGFRPLRVATRTKHGAPPGP